MKANSDLLTINNISKSYGGIPALESVSFSIENSSIHALCGENGAGKSTLMKILSGEVSKDSGEIFYKGYEIHWHSPRDAINYGISIISQELHPLFEMTVAENIYLGREQLKGLFVDKAKMNHEAKEYLNYFGLLFSPETKMKDLSVAQMQMVEIVKAISRNSQVLIMDEPTSAIGEQESKLLFEIIKKLKSEGKTIIYISHRLKEIYEIADKVTVLRDGKHIITTSLKDFSSDDLVAAMIGKKLTDSYFKSPKSIENRKELLTVKNLTRGTTFTDISFSLHEQEILGIFGLMGSGRSALLQALFGIKTFEHGEIFLQGKKIDNKYPSRSLQANFACVTEDRKETGLVLGHSIADNIILPSLNKYPSSLGFLKKNEDKKKINSMIDLFRIKANSLEQTVYNLSGGNQQKVVLGKWILTQPTVLLLDEPTRGIDVGAKQEIYQFMNDYISKGKGIIMVSSELPEIIAMSHRVLIFKKGNIVAERTRNEFDQEEFMHLVS